MHIQFHAFTGSFHAYMHEKRNTVLLSDKACKGIFRNSFLESLNKPHSHHLGKS